MQSLIYEYARSNRFGDVICLFSQMVSRGSMLDYQVWPSVVKACGGLSAPKIGRQVHCVGITSGFGSDSFIASSLIHMYLRCNRLGDAGKVFDRMPEPDVVACGAMVSGYARKGLVEEAKGLLARMREIGLQPNEVTWNGLIAGLSCSGEQREAILMFRKMHSEGAQLDGVIFLSVLPAVRNMRMLNMGTQIHGQVIKRGLEWDTWVVSGLIDMYGKCAGGIEISKMFDEMEIIDVGVCNALITGLSRNGLVDNALQAFRRFEREGINLNVISWTSVIAGCSQNGKDMEALELFREMQLHGLKPNSVTIPSLLPACGNIASLKHGKSAHCFSLKSGITGDVHVDSALVDMYAKCGKMNLSRLCFDMMPTRNLVSWNAMIHGYAMHGNYKKAVDLFQLMQKSGRQPDHVTFTSLLSACSHCGMSDEGLYYFNSMSRDHGIEAQMEHYACVVCLLSRSGRLKEAYAMITQMPFEPNGCVWGALLSSCRVQRNLDLGEVAAKKLFELEPKNPGNYILLSNIYASKAMWAEVDRVRDMMKSKGLRKNPGCSWIELKDKMHMLLAGDSSHPQMSQINEKLLKLNMEMKKSGHFAITDFVLHDVEEQDKEQILCGHSEKLAVVLGLLNTSPGSPVRVIKNLRICGDCHAVIKLISSFEQREIFVRDANRFHHFKDGVCSCRDYW